MAIPAPLQVLGKKDVHITVQDTVTTSQFAAIWSSLGVQVGCWRVVTQVPGYEHSFKGYGLHA